MRYILVLIYLLMCSFVKAESLPEIKVGVLQYGTINWELSHIKSQQLDIQNGFQLVVVPMANKNAAAIALQSNTVDVIMSDVFWVARQRHLGKDYQILPMHKISGGVYGKPDSPFSIKALSQYSLGVAGGATDKNFVILQSYAAMQHTPITTNNVKFGAPPLLHRMFTSGQLDLMLNFWHYNARASASGFVNLLPVSEMLAYLNIDTEVPLMGWVASEDWMTQNKTVFQSFVTQSWRAKQRFITKPVLWESVRALTKAENDDVFHALRDAYPATILTDFTPVQANAFEQLFKIVVDAEQTALLGDMKQLPDRVFWQGSYPLWQTWQQQSANITSPSTDGQAR